MYRSSLLKTFKICGSLTLSEEAGVSLTISEDTAGAVSVSTGGLDVSGIAELVVAYYLVLSRVYSKEGRRVLLSIGLCNNCCMSS